MFKDGDKWIVPVEDLSVTQCLIDYAFSLVAWESDKKKFSIRIETEFLFISSDKEYLLQAEKEPTTLCPVLAILHQEIKSLIVLETGKLELRLVNGDCIIVLPDPNYEAWNLDVAGGYKLVCLPGGGLAYWTPD